MYTTWLPQQEGCFVGRPHHNVNMTLSDELSIMAAAKGLSQNKAKIYFKHKATPFIHTLGVLT